MRPGVAGEDEAGAGRGDCQGDSSQWIRSQFGNNPPSPPPSSPPSPISRSASPPSSSPPSPPSPPSSYSMNIHIINSHCLSSFSSFSSFSSLLKLASAQQCRLVGWISISAIAAISLSFHVSVYPTHLFSPCLYLAFSILCPRTTFSLNPTLVPFSSRISII